MSGWKKDGKAANLTKLCMMEEAVEGQNGKKEKLRQEKLLFIYWFLLKVDISFKHDSDLSPVTFTK